MEQRPEGPKLFPLRGVQWRAPKSNTGRRSGTPPSGVEAWIPLGRGWPGASAVVARAPSWRQRLRANAERPKRGSVVVETPQGAVGVGAAISSVLASRADVLSVVASGATVPSDVASGADVRAIMRSGAALPPIVERVPTVVSARPPPLSWGAPTLSCGTARPSPLWWGVSPLCWGQVHPSPASSFTRMPSAVVKRK